MKNIQIKSKENTEEIIKFISRKKRKIELAIARIITKEIRNNLKKDKDNLITFKDNYIGSKSRNLLTQSKNDEPFDFDIDLEIQNKTKVAKPEIIFELIKKVIPTKVNYENKQYLIRKKKKGEGSNIITIKIENKDEIIFTIDYALTKIENNKLLIYQNNSWNQKNIKIEKIKPLANQIKNENHWNDLRDKYLKLKIDDFYSKINTPSYILYIQAIHYIYNEFCK